MDPNLIYTKTASGEEAMRQRTRVVQRNMRMVLILVDGKATVADLCGKTANQKMTESALHDLEQGGFIEQVLEQDSVWEQSKKVAQEIKVAALGHASQFPLPAANRDLRVEPSAAPSPASVQDPSLSPLSAASIHSLELPAMDNVSTFGVQSVLDLPKAPPRPDQDKPLAFVGRLKAWLPSKKPANADDDYLLKPIRRGGASKPLTLLLGVLGVVVLLFFVVLLFPYNSYLSEVEAELAQASGQPAKVGEIHVSFYPKPGLFLRDVRLGNARDGKEIRISEMRLLPVVGTIGSRRKLFREVELNDVDIPAEALAGFSGMFDAVAQPSASIGVQHVTLEKTNITFQGLVLSEMNGEIKLAPDARFNSLILYSPNRSLLFEAKPAATGIDIALEAYGWRPSQTSLFVFDSGSIKGNLNGASLILSKIELRVFDGRIEGGAVLRASLQPSMAGDISFERISAKRLGEALGIGSQFEGETSGKMKFTTTANSWSSLFFGIDADGEFTMRRGVLGAIDLTEAVRRSPTALTQGGSTRFEQMSGRFKLSSDSYRFFGLALSSGLMQSVGQLAVSKDLQVSGSMEVQMRGTANQLRMPVSISGPLKAPLVQAGKR